MQTALVVELPELDAVIDEHRRLFDPARARGLMAHVTALFPFVDTDQLTEGAADAVAAIAAETDPFRATFREVRWFGDNVAWLAPEPADPFIALTVRLAEQFPMHQPYGGEFPDVISHATIGHRGPLDGVDTAARAIEIELPVSASALSLSLMERDSSDRWILRRRFPFGRTA